MEYLRRTCFLLFPAFVFVSCHGQSSPQISKSALNDQRFIAIGDTVKELADSILIVFQDKHNVYWFGSNGRGIYRYDGNVILQLTTKHGLCNNRIWGIQEDNAGNIFFNTRGGISKFDGQTFTTLKVEKNNFPGNGWQLEPDDLWFPGVQDSGGVYRYDAEGKSGSLYFLRFPPTALGEEYNAKHPRSKYPNMGFSPYDVYSIYKDSKGRIWFGTGTLGVCCYDGKSFTWITENDVTELDDGPANGVRSVIEDKDGKFWFSNTLYRYNIYPADSAGENGLKYKREKSIGSLDGKEKGSLDFYMSIVKDKNELWITTFGAGVWRYDPEAAGGKNITNYPVTDGDQTVPLYSIYKDREGVLWLGTHTDGAYKFNGTVFEKFKP
jgi:ligand-binding sensor domain-containing protein